MILWWELELELATDVANDAAALIVDAGAMGAEVEDGPSDRTLVRVSFAKESTEAEALATTRAALTSIDIEPPTLRIQERSDADWSERWKEHFTPLLLGERIWVVPSWHEEFEPPDGTVTLELDPGMAFGTGQHATTALCLEWLETHLADAKTEELSILDVGCGSGILAIACAKLGAAQVIGIDNDDVAVTVARANAAKNRVKIECSNRPLADVGSHDVVVANILAGTLIRLADDLVRCTAPGGWLMLSGILAEQMGEVVTAIRVASERAGRRPFEPTRCDRDEWVCLAGRL